ncbi:DUF262 domain-containing protein [Henriciella mobilis]|uniref:GmrSD restriction endonuclease domain-containing protein n=1 Tax=Henriciella mobilis TaxID=2305467 RepID=UPI000E66E97A|nr:DUF262 domain-containing protein [Henriciella mobilis]RIJ14067.1 DUF262 domain-containing protein [Henriciella mobilis]RIJ19185.1 DUF262 domain-containing protein [Henriciella mobilis]
MFNTNPKDLKALLNEVHSESLQLPDFQRDWVWTDEGVRQLLASVAAGFPIGAILTLETGGELKFKTRALAHAPTTGVEPEELLLDGQQRMTSLYQALRSDQPVQTQNSKGKAMSLYYYIDMKRALHTARLEDAIFSVLSDRTLRSNFNKDIDLDLRTTESECQQFMFPLNKALDVTDWLLAFTAEHGSAQTEFFKAFKEQIIDRIVSYKVPVITLTKANSREAVCTVFEKVNVGGKKLDAFELLTAIFAADNFDLREDLRGTDRAAFIAKHRREPKNDELKEGRLVKIKGPAKSGVLAGLDERDVLQVACALQTHAERRTAIADGKTDQRDIPAVSIKANDLLKLDCHIFQQNAEQLTDGYIHARNFFERLNIIRERDIPYLPTGKTIAAVHASMERPDLNAAQMDQLAQWFWAVTLGETYGTSTDTRVARDMLELLDWLEGGNDQPRAITEISIRADRLDELRSRTSAGYKALHAAILNEGCLDFRTGKEARIMDAHDDPVDIHHIFPKKWAIDKGIGADRYDSIINKTPLFAQTNRLIGGRAPSEYLGRLESELAKSESTDNARDRLDDILRSHLIEPQLLRTDDFDAFYEDRKEKLLQLIERKTGREILRTAGSNEEDDAQPDVRILEEVA